MLFRTAVLALTLATASAFVAIPRAQVREPVSRAHPPLSHMRVGNMQTQPKTTLPIAVASSQLTSAHTSLPVNVLLLYSL